MKVFDVSSHAGGAIDLPGFGTIQYVTSDNGQRGDTFLPILGLVQHWTAGDRLTVYAAYHWGIVDNGREAAIIRTLKPTEKGQHAWGNNTHLAGAAYAATADASKPNYGPGAPTDRQREAMGILGGEFCAWHKLDPRGTLSLPKKESNATTIWTVPGFDTVPVIMSHQTLAKLNGYAGERWDTGNLLEGDRHAAQVVHDALKAGTRAFTLAGLL